MVFLGQRDGLKLYIYKYYESPVSNSNEGYVAKKELIVYRDNNFYLQVTETNATTVMNYFNVDRAQLD